MNEVVTWSGVWGGLAVGLYAITQLTLTGRPLGVSTGYGNLCALVSKSACFQEYRKAAEDWRLWFLFGLPLGGVIAVWSGGSRWRASLSLGTLYDSVFPDALFWKGLLLLTGGVLMGYGARLAGGCTSGHCIAGLAYRNPPSLLASLGFFAGGIAMVQVLFAL